METLHLLSNAHLDPVWQWQWEEGAAAALSTFRVAVEFCEKNEGYVFNHNEALLYEWIEEYEPQLFERIAKQIELGRWHVMGGTFIQPDCNMPSGEALVRQILYGRKYFADKFHKTPKTAISFDAFGHSAGLVQVLKKAGYHSILVKKPHAQELKLPGETFIWKGLDGTEILAHRLPGFYNTPLGKATEIARNWLSANEDIPIGLFPWGVGNHGGGPSRKDLKELNEFRNEHQDIRIIHSTPEAYFEEIDSSGVELPVFEDELNPIEVGCYTSQARIKRKYRQLENEYFSVEKMAAWAAAQEKMKYPAEELNDALRDLLFAQFHDIITGTSVQPAEEDSLNLIGHGLEILRRVRAHAFFALTSGCSAPSEGEQPILVYNPHPYEIDTTVECEFMLPDQNWQHEFSCPVVYCDGKELPSQPEKENSNFSLDWRKRVAFRAKLKPSSMNRFSVFIRKLPEKPQPVTHIQKDRIVFKNEQMTVGISCKTGLVDFYTVDGIDYLKPNAFAPLVIDDIDDSWGAVKHYFRDVVGAFRLMTPEEVARFAGIKTGPLAPVQVIEDGAVRTVVEALMAYGNSYISQKYKLPKVGTEVEVETMVFWNEKTKMLKMSLPTMMNNGKYLGQTVYGVQKLKMTGQEVVSQRWVALNEENRSITCINDCVYGSDCCDGEIRFSLVRSPGYTCSDLSQFGHKGRPVMPEGRFSTRIDQGVHTYRFWFNAGFADERMANVERESLFHNETPFALAMSPSGCGEAVPQGPVIEGSAVQMTAFKKAESDDNYIIRLFEPSGQERSITLSIPGTEIKENITFAPFEIKSYRLDLQNAVLTETDLMK